MPTEGSYRIQQLFDKSDLVCAGEALHSSDIVEKAEAFEGASILQTLSRKLTVAATRCYKGDASGPLTVQYTIHEPEVGPGDLWIGDGQRALLFLKRLGPATVTFSDPYWGWLQDPNLDSLAPALESGLKQLEADLVYNLARLSAPLDISKQLRALHGFDTLGSPTVEVVRRLTRDSSARVALAAFSVMIKVDPAQELAPFCEFVQSNKSEVAQLAIGYDFSFQKVRDPRALECLARSPIRWISMEALDAIRAIKSPLSVPELVRHLDDSDPETQYIAYITLFEITKRPDEKGWNVEAFAQNREEIVASWKQWWNESGKLKYPDR